MPTEERTTFLPDVSAQQLWDWHQRPGAFERLLPPWAHMRVVDALPALEEGAMARFELARFGLRLSWQARHHDVTPGSGFTDTQVRGPFRRWVHTHRFEDAPGGANLHDRIDWDLPLPPLGRWVAGASIRRELSQMLHFRHQRTADDLSFHQRFAAQPRLRVGITGASGLVGTALSAFLTTGGHTVVSFSRRAAPGRAILWRPTEGVLDPASLNDLDAIIHLAGEPIAGGRWNPDRKRRIRDSRVLGTALIAEAIAACERPPPVFISASAVGIYGHRDEPVDEASPPGDGFLAEVGTAWEAAADPARRAGVRVVHPRISVVLDGTGGALPKMLPPFRLGLGGPLGSGAQGHPWIALEDLVRLLATMLHRDDMVGPYNACTPTPISQAAFARALGAALNRPAFIPAPAFAVRLLLGEMADAVLLHGAHVVPTRTLDAGFSWKHPDAEAAIRYVLGRGS